MPVKQSRIFKYYDLKKVRYKGNNKKILIFFYISKQNFTNKMASHRIKDIKNKKLPLHVHFPKHKEL